jgi:hypothetical protein
MVLFVSHLNNVVHTYALLSNYCPKYLSVFFCGIENRNISNLRSRRVTSARVQVLYDSAVSDLPVSRYLQTEYTSYLDRSLKVLLEISMLQFLYAQTCFFQYQ